MNCVLPAARSAHTARRRGVALIITLIMLSVVTITAVAFLAMSRRERLSISAYGEQIDARFLADTALNRAKADLVNRMFGSSNRFGYGLAVSTNYRNPNFTLNYFGDSGLYRHLTNVSYSKNLGPLAPFNFNLEQAADRRIYAGLLGNLFYDPRPPVFYQVSANPRVPWEFRYYLDLNRNGRAETNGFLPVTDQTGRTNAAWGGEQFVGDPEWIGVLEHPDAPHSGTNRFIGRFAYLILPTGRSLDINHLGNSAKLPGIAGTQPNRGATVNSGYLRNQGVGSWELNAAGFLRALNTNVWQLNDFNYFTSTTPSSGFAFSDAERILRFRRNNFVTDSAERFFGYEVGIFAATPGNRLRTDLVDNYANGPVAQSLNEVVAPSLQASVDNDDTDTAWSGADERRRFTDINQVFESSLDLASRITGQEQASTSVQPLVNSRAAFRQEHTNSTYNAYTYYRALGQLGTESADARFESGFNVAYGRVNGGRPFPTYFRRAKLNLNYAHDPNGDRPANASVASLQRWNPLSWFTNAADRLLLTEFTNGLPIVRSPEIARNVARDARSFAPFGFPVHGAVPLADGSLTNYVYDAQVHRLLQLAANIYDYANAPERNDLNVAAGTGTNNFRLHAPHVFRPRFYVDDRSPDVLRIGDYELVENPALVAQRWLTPDQALNFVRAAHRGLPGSVIPSTDINVLGIPWVIGAKKGLPNFNEGFWQTAVQLTRRLVITKPTSESVLPDGQLPFTGSNGRGFRTLAQYRITLTNSIGIEGLNSYSFNFPVPVQVDVWQTNRYVLYAENPNGTLTPVMAPPPLQQRLVRRLPAGAWEAGEVVGFRETVTTNVIYDPIRRQVFRANLTNVGYVDVGIQPALTLAVTNQMVFAVTTTGNPRRLLDVVSMQSVIYETNITRYLGGQGGPNAITVAGVSGDQRPGGEMSRFWLTNRVAAGGTMGITNQFAMSLGRFAGQGRYDLLWRDARGAGVRLQDKNFSIDGLNFFLYLTNRTGFTAGRDTELRREFGGTSVQVGFNPSPLLVFTDRRMANDPLVHYHREDLLPGYTAVALASPGFPGAYAAEVERNGARLLQDGSVWPLNWRTNGARWLNFVFGPVGFRVAGDWPNTLTTNFWTDQIPVSPLAASTNTAPRRYQVAKAPWGRVPQLGVTATGGNVFARRNLAIKDPQIFSSDNWRFLIQATNAPPNLEHASYPNIGWLGRVHRGTPWQTTYLKSEVADLRQQNGLDGAPWMALFFGEMNDWASWSGNANTHPVTDWKLMDLFTTAINDNAALGLMAVNQTNLAAWAAVLGGVPVLDNRTTANNPQSLILRPDSAEIAQIISGYTNNSVVVPGLMSVLRTTNSLAAGFAPQPIAPGGTFTNLGSILSVPTLSDRAPFVVADAGAVNVTDEVVERLPQQILSLLRADEPMVTVYAYGQSLKPAPNSFFLQPGPFYGMVTNYVVTGEVSTKSVLRFEGATSNPTTKVEDHRILFQNP
jgi:hypothetical protein